MNVRVGPVVFAVVGADYAFDDDFNALRRFVVDEPADATVFVSAGSVDNTEWRQSLLVDFSLDPGSRLLGVRKTEWDATFDLERAQVTARLPGPWTRAVDSLLATAVQVFTLTTGRGLLFHGSCVARDGGAYLFTGRSGAGKTTAAYLSRERGAEILAEEMTAVTHGRDASDVAVSGPQSASPAVWTLPLWQKDGTRARPASLPLRGVFVLEQAEADAVEPLARAEATKALLRRVTLGVRIPLLMDLAAEAVARTVARTPVYRLRFTRSPAFWDEIDRALSGSSR